jgi:prepilin-type N-terminal cleavage/methylation domain-containing protein
MLHDIRKLKRGFTIIEVMIVLAIAGLILLIVFLAVPALQRSSRNTQRKDEASQVLGSIADYVSNNDGTLPTAGTLAQAASNANLKFYSASNIYFGSMGNIPTTATNGGNGSATTLTTEDLIFLAGAKCSGTTATAQNASSRSYALLYAVEGANAASPQCVGS